MLNLNVNQNRTLNFEIQLSGIDHKQLTGFLRIIVDSVEYGFKCEISEADISVDIPSLKSLINREIKEGEKLESRLEVFGSGYYLNPWNDSFLVKNPVVLEAKIKEEKDEVLTETPKVVVKTVDSKSPKADQKLKEMREVVKEKEVVKSVLKKKLVPPITRETLTEDHIYKYIGKKTKNKAIQEEIFNQAKLKAKGGSLVEVLRIIEEDLGGKRNSK